MKEWEWVRKGDSRLVMVDRKELIKILDKIDELSKDAKTP